MDRLDGAANLMIVSDLDLTMVDHDDEDNNSLLKFNALWETYYRRDSLLVFSTGRSPTIYRKLRKEKPLLTPDITITSVGTEITYGDSMGPDDEWEQFLNQNWNRDAVIEETSKFPELIPQSETEQRPHKVSFFIEKDKAMDVANALSESLEKRGLDIKVICSSGTALDILPKRAGKGEALAYLLKKFEANGKVPVNVLVCGDSGNDVELFSVSNVYGVMVSNAQEELLQWYVENAKDNHRVVHATERCAGGIIQAIGIFQLGPNLSPREIKDHKGCKSENCDPGGEMVKFYLLYERWRRAEVEKSESYLHYLKSIFDPEGIVVHPSGIERPSHECIDTILCLHGDKRGAVFQTWVDRLYSAQISTDTWLVRFDKWELSEKEVLGCSTTVLMRLEVWLDGSKSQEQSTWLF